jgi:nucleotide-binding universal stress UspA family protein
VARELTERFGSTLHVIASSGGKPVDIDGLARVDGITWDERPPVDALVAASAAADLVVVGSRGLHGLSGLGSVSERVAHRGGCSVLVVHRSVATRC